MLEENGVKTKTEIGGDFPLDHYTLSKNIPRLLQILLAISCLRYYYTKKYESARFAFP
jgi:hypothetical protein